MLSLLTWLKWPLWSKKTIRVLASPARCSDTSPVIAKDKGIVQFHAEVLPENKGMLAVFNRSGFPVDRNLTKVSLT